MAGAADLQSVFTTCARTIAFARCLPDAERRGSGVVLELNRSQFARDGLSANARRFAQLASQRGLTTPSDIKALALLLASGGPVDVWWRPAYVSAHPAALNRDDHWMSLEELRLVARELEPGLTAKRADTFV